MKHMIILNIAEIKVALRNILILDDGFTLYSDRRVEGLVIRNVKNSVFV